MIHARGARGAAPHRSRGAAPLPRRLSEPPRLYLAALGRSAAEEEEPRGRRREEEGPRREEGRGREEGERREEAGGGSKLEVVQLLL